MPLNARQRGALKHSNKLGAGAKARKGLRGQEKVGVVMREWNRGTLHSGSGGIVPKSNRKQAIAIALSEAGLSRKKKKKDSGWKSAGRGVIVR